MLETNSFYQFAFDTDFSKITDEKSLRQEFAGKIKELVKLIDKSTANSFLFTEVAEAFHYGTLSAVLMRYKAKRRHEEIIKTSAPENSVNTMVLSQLIKDDKPEEFDFDGIDNVAESKKLANIMSEDFSYTGKCMRALAMVALMSCCSCRKNDMFNPHMVLREYAPMNILLEDTNDGLFTVIGSVKKNSIAPFDREYSILPETLYQIERDNSSGFSEVFAYKLREILGYAQMDYLIDRARVEETRDFLADSLCRFFFDIRVINLPRVFSLINLVQENVNESGCISEDKLNEIVPTECKGLLGKEAILTKDTVDTNTTWYKVNGGVKNFLALARQFHLFDGCKSELIEKVVNKLN